MAEKILNEWREAERLLKTVVVRLDSHHPAYQSAKTALIFAQARIRECELDAAMKLTLAETPVTEDLLIEKQKPDTASENKYPVWDSDLMAGGEI